MRRALGPAIILLALTMAVGIASAKTIRGTNDSEILGGTPQNDKIVARNGNDFVGGNRGDDKLLGGNGDDELYGQLGKDVTKGGDGSDRLSGFDPLNPAFPTRAMRRLQRRGGSGDLPGVDKMFGGAGADILEGSLGGDTESGGPGPDLIYGDPGADTLSGGPGNDEIHGEEGPDEMSGGNGDDRIDAVDNDTGAVDKIRCGPGDDQVAASVGDQVSGDCEFIAPSLPR